MLHRMVVTLLLTGIVGSSYLAAQSWSHGPATKNGNYCCEDNGNTGCCPAGCDAVAGLCPDETAYLSAGNGVGKQWGQCTPLTTFTCTSYAPYYCCRRGLYSVGPAANCPAASLVCYEYSGFNGGCDPNVAIEKCP